MASFKVTDNCPDGALVGNSATSKVGFYGATPVVQQTAAGVVTGASDATALAAAITAISLAMHNLGLTN